MKTLIHPTAVIHPGAELHPTVQVGPCGDWRASESWSETVLGAHVVLEGPTEIVQIKFFQEPRLAWNRRISSMMVPKHR